MKIFIKTFFFIALLISINSPAKSSLQHFSIDIESLSYFGLPFLRIFIINQPNIGFGSHWSSNLSHQLNLDSNNVISWWNPEENITVLFKIDQKTNSWFSENKTYKIILNQNEYILSRYKINNFYFNKRGSLVAISRANQKLRIIRNNQQNIIKIINHYNDAYNFKWENNKIKNISLQNKVLAKYSYEDGMLKLFSYQDKDIYKYKYAEMGLIQIDSLPKNTMTQNNPIIDVKPTTIKEKKDIYFLGKINSNRFGLITSINSPSRDAIIIYNKSNKMKKIKIYENIFHKKKPTLIQYKIDYNKFGRIKKIYESKNGKSTRQLVTGKENNRKSQTMLKRFTNYLSWIEAKKYQLTQ